jgi:hypothetical protein
MDKNLHDNIDDIFREPLQAFRERPVRKVWENIEQELDKDKRRAFLYLFGNRVLRLGAACVIFLWIPLGIVFDRGGINKPVAAAEALPVGGVSPAAVSSSRATVHASRATVHASSALIPVAAAPTAALWAQTIEQWASQRSVGLAPLRLEPSTATLALAPVPVNRVNSMKKLSPVHLADPPRRWSLTGYFAQELAGYNLADHDSTAASGREIDKKATSLFSASGGLLVGYRLSKKWLIQSGFIYSWSRSISDPSVAYAVTDNNGNTKYKLNTPTGYGFLPSSSSIGDSVETDQSSTRLHYLSIPLIASYAFDVKRFTFLTGAGVIGNLLTSATVASKIKGPSSPQAESIVTLYGLRKINYGLFLKAEIQYAIRADWSVNLTLTSKNALTPINTNMTYSTFPYYVGLGIGMTHRF